MGFPWQEYWSGLPLPFPEGLPNPGMAPLFPVLAGGFVTAEPLGEPSYPINSGDLSGMEMNGPIEKAHLIL